MWLSDICNPMLKRLLKGFLLLFTACQIMYMCLSREQHVSLPIIIAANIIIPQRVDVNISQYIFNVFTLFM